MPHVMQRDRPALLEWAGRTGIAIDADPSHVHESTWADFLRDRVSRANRDPVPEGTEPMTIRYATTPPDAEWQGFWKDAVFNPLAWESGAPGKEAVLELHARLLSLGGWAVCVRDVGLAPILLEKGSHFDGTGAEMRIGRPRDCHENSSELAKADPSLTAHYGYALSADGMWREHSWCLRTDGRIVETTTARVAYYGAPDGA
jgi:hypothetical protein